MLPAFKRASYALCRQSVRPYRRKKPKASGITRHGPKFRLGNRIGRWQRAEDDRIEHEKNAARKCAAMMKALGYEPD